MSEAIDWRLTVWDENDKEYKMVDIPHGILQDIEEWLNSEFGKEGEE